MNAAAMIPMKAVFFMVLLSSRNFLRGKRGDVTAPGAGPQKNEPSAEGLLG
jgi:hypothetical protein